MQDLSAEVTRIDILLNAMKTVACISTSSTFCLIREVLNVKKLFFKVYVNYILSLSKKKYSVHDLCGPYIFKFTFYIEFTLP